MSYFQNCQTDTECKTAYRSLFLLHSKDANTMAVINSELKDTLQAIANFAAVQTEVIPETTANDKTAQIQAAAKFAKQLPGVTVEITGLWVWVNGVKREDKNLQTELHNYGFKYAFKKCAWYFHNMQGFRTRKQLSMDQIRIKYAGEATEQKMF